MSIYNLYNAEIQRMRSNCVCNYIKLLKADIPSSRYKHDILRLCRTRQSFILLRDMLYFDKYRPFHLNWKILGYLYTIWQTLQLSEPESSCLSATSPHIPEIFRSRIFISRLHFCPAKNPFNQFIFVVERQF